MKVLDSPMLPIPPSPGEEARRRVRHGLAAAFADFETWAGPVGPAPDDQTHAIAGLDPADPDEQHVVVFVSRQLYDQLAAMPRGKTVSWDLPGLRSRSLIDQDLVRRVAAARQRLDQQLLPRMARLPEHHLDTQENR